MALHPFTLSPPSACTANAVVLGLCLLVIILQESVFLECPSKPLASGVRNPHGNVTRSCTLDNLHLTVVPPGGHTLTGK